MAVGHISDNILFSYHSALFCYASEVNFQALDLFERSGHQQSFLPTSLDDLDKKLHGGLTCGTITEVTGSYFPLYCIGSLSHRDHS